MAKFEISLELKELKLSIKGERDQIPQLTQAAGQQLGGLLAAAAPALSAAGPPRVVPTEPSPDSEPTPEARPRTPATRVTRRAPQKDKPEEQIVWKHDPGKWGNPSQQWGPGDKMLWIMLVIRSEAKKSEITAAQVYNAFNRQFKEAGALVTKNATRELRKLKGTQPAFIGEDASGAVSKWFLTQEGIKRAESLVHQLLHPTSAAEKEPAVNGAAKPPTT